MEGYVYNAKLVSGKYLEGKSIPYLISEKSVVKNSTTALFGKLASVFNILRARTFTVFNKFILKRIVEESPCEIDHNLLKIIIREVTKGATGGPHHIPSSLTEEVQHVISHNTTFTTLPDTHGIHMLLVRSILPLFTRTIDHNVDPSGDGFLSTMKMYVKTKYNVMTDTEASIMVECIQKKCTMPPNNLLDQMNSRGTPRNTVAMWLRDEVNLYPDTINTAVEKYLLHHDNPHYIGSLLKTMGYLRDKFQIKRCFIKFPNDMRKNGLRHILEMAKEFKNNRLKMKRYCFLKYRHHMIQSIAKSSSSSCMFDFKHLTLLPEMTPDFPIRIHKDMINPTSRTTICNWIKRNGIHDFDKYKSIDDLFDLSGILNKTHKDNGWNLCESIRTDGVSVVFTFTHSRKRTIEEIEDDSD